MPNNKKQEQDQGYATSPGMEPSDQSGNFRGESEAQPHPAGEQTSGQGQPGGSSAGTGYGKSTGQNQGAAARQQPTDDETEVDYDESNQGNRSDSPESNKVWSPGSGQPST